MQESPRPANAHNATRPVHWFIGAGGTRQRPPIFAYHDRVKQAPAGAIPRRTVPTVAVAVWVVAFALAMAYVESAVVVYLRGALDLEPDRIFPILGPEAVGSLTFIELGRELATLVMLAAIGVLVGRTALERLAWSAVAFGVWDIGYYAWLWVFIGWPTGLDTWDLLFLLPLPWVGPVWAPVAVSCALVGFGLAGAVMIRRGVALRIRPWQGAAGLLGGLLVILSFVVDAPAILDGGLPRNYPWWIFAAGMAVGVIAAVSVLRDARLERA